MSSSLNCARCKVSRKADDERLSRAPYCDYCGALLWQGDPKAVTLPAAVAHSPSPTCGSRRTWAPGIVSPLRSVLAQSTPTDRTTTLLLLSLIGLLGVGYTAFAMAVNMNVSFSQHARSKPPAKVRVAAAP